MERREEPLNAGQHHPCRAARKERSKEVAVYIGISERMVKAHLASIYNKLGVDSRAAAIAVAAQNGLLKEQ
ncbi:MAG TPA: LuxR C-terminal-related transcriptional regulator [Anaerolineales bacterium]|nr:LuxR C-terminal-related transcriptional regulator [Anaerolineales bacterium]